MKHAVLLTTTLTFVTTFVTALANAQSISSQGVTNDANASEQLLEGNPDRKLKEPAKN